ncbi:protein TolQ [Luteimonas sp BLCC-B24]|uniref:protein TolQ n=1 Tax=Luteimonas sp. BLCC-B24 TaxID=3025317 RepID=UPI00234D3D9C|nr:protein TolQ [Luteimonas sp. BLCC-B24]MDC7806142.1 protein TolQ [Luteimonas sp. BLCC-B24]
MSPMPVLLQSAAQVQALPEESAAAATELASTGGAAAAVAPLPTDLSILDLILHASIPVQIVMLLLLFASISSWVIIFRKKRMLDRAEKEADRFEERFWSGAEVGKLYASATERNREIEGLEAIFEAGYREYSRQRQRRGIDSRTQLEGAQRGMRVAGSRELDGLERNLEYLANVGSIAPYVGLLGTVWGIMISFHGLANVKEATIATVAPGISEALIATAMGLFAAIPAVWAYNRFATKVERIASRYEAFSDEFSSILERQSGTD